MGGKNSRGRDRVEQGATPDRKPAQDHPWRHGCLSAQLAHQIVDEIVGPEDAVGALHQGDVARLQ